MAASAAGRFLLEAAAAALAAASGPGSTSPHTASKAAGTHFELLLVSKALCGTPLCIRKPDNFKNQE